MVTNASRVGLRRRSLAQKVVALVPLLLLLASWPEQAFLRCRGDGHLRAVCCCPEAADADSARDASGDQPGLSEPSCCDREMVGGHLPPSDVRRDGARLGTAPLLALVPLFPPVLRAPPLPARVLSLARPAREGRSIVVLKQAFLI